MRSQRSVRTLRALPLAAALLAALPAAAQRPITALLRDPSGAPVAAARGWLRTEPRFRLAALPTPLPIASKLPTARAFTATSDARGVLRFGDEAAGMPETAGSGYVVTDDGLGALLPRLHAGRADRLTLQPLAAVARPGGSEAFTLHAVAVLPDQRRVALPPLRGAEVRLPAGTYEVWGESEDGLTWQRLTLRSGERAELSFAGAAQRLHLPERALVHPAARPDLSWDLRGSAGELLLRGPALAAPLVTWLDGVVTPPRVVPGPPTSTALGWPPQSDRDDEREVFRLADGVDDATLFGLRRHADGSFRVVGYARATGGEFALPRRADGDGWLLLVASDRAALALPWSTTAPGTVLSADRGRPLRVIARDDGGLPIADLRVDYVPDGAEAATVLAHTDADGAADLGLVTAPGTLYVRDERYRNEQVELADVPAEPFALVARDGARCRGTASLQGGAACATIVVTLRDPSGRLQPAERAVVVASDEPFSFGGLPDDRDLVLFATAWRDGRTWSVRQRVRGGDVVALTLRDEDPQPLDRR